MERSRAGAAQREIRRGAGLERADSVTVGEPEADGETGAGAGGIEAGGAWLAYGLLDFTTFEEGFGLAPAGVAD